MIHGVGNGVLDGILEGSEAAEATGIRPVREPAIRVARCGHWDELLQQLGVGVIATTYQAGRLLGFSVDEDGTGHTVQRSLARPMGVAIDGDRMAVVCRNEVWYFRDEHHASTGAEAAPPAAASFTPRRAHVTGNILGHEVAWGRDPDADSAPNGHARSTLWVVNTRFSCLATLEGDWSFVPRWRPHFVTDLMAEDRCHLNGLAVIDGRPRFVTALGATNTAKGWRDDRATGGCVIDVDSGEPAVHGLCMPHSPRWHDGRLWILESGKGELLALDPATGRRDVIARLPGFVRGLSFAGRYAFVGLSRIREGSLFTALPVTESFDRLHCGIWVVDVITGRTVASVRFEGRCSEMFDVQVIPGIRRLGVVGFRQKTIEHTYSVPPDADGRD